LVTNREKARFENMEKIDRRSRSLWMDIDVMRGAQKLTNDHECDTVIIGAGIAGISTAYELARRGQKVIVIDRGKIAGGITARTTAHLAPLCDDLTSEMMKLRSKFDCKGVYESQARPTGSRRSSRRKTSIVRGMVIDPATEESGVSGVDVPRVTYRATSFLSLWP
jgi:2-polyprenyl-6-methoxyphenol hydroxylase-like FAD-dependent oxidoreductase